MSVPQLLGKSREVGTFKSHLVNSFTANEEEVLFLCFHLFQYYCGLDFTFCNCSCVMLLSRMFAPFNSTSKKSQPERLHLERLKLDKLAFRRFNPERLAPERF